MLMIQIILGRFVRAVRALESFTPAWPVTDPEDPLTSFAPCPILPLSE